MSSCRASLAVSSEVGTPWTRKLPLRRRSPRALTNAWAARPEPRPMREPSGTNSSARSTIVMGNLHRSCPWAKRHSSPRKSQLLLSGSHDLLGAEAELLDQILQGSRRTKGTHTDPVSRGAGVLGPAERRGLLHRDARRHVWGQHAV